MAWALVALFCLLSATFHPVLASDSALASVQDAPARGQGPSFGTKLVWAFQIFVILSVIALVLLAGTLAFLFWRAKKLVENAVRPDLPKLERIVERLRQKHPDLDNAALTKKLMHRQANRAGLVGLLTGIGGLPTLPFTVPIDVALTVKIQSNLVHMLRLLRGEHADAGALSDSSLWLITTGGQELTTASSVLIRDLVVKSLSKSLLKFLPLLGGVVGYALNWFSTQALGRLTLKWMTRRGIEG
jgi:hypothetical protein